VRPTLMSLSMQAVPVIETAQAGGWGGDTRRI